MGGHVAYANPPESRSALASFPDHAIFKTRSKSLELMELLGCEGEETPLRSVPKLERKMLPNEADYGHENYFIGDSRPPGVG